MGLQLALANAVRDTLRMGDVLEKMFRDLQVALTNNDSLLLQEVRDSDEVIRDFNAGIKGYLTELGRETLEEEDEKRCTEIITFTTNLENVSNIVTLNLGELAERSANSQVSFSMEDKSDHAELFEKVLANLNLSFSVFLTRETVQAASLIEEKQQLRKSELKAVNAHLDRLRQSATMDESSSALHLGLLSDLRRINSLISSVAYPIVKERERRLKELKKKGKKEKSKEKFGPASSL